MNRKMKKEKHQGCLMCISNVNASYGHLFTDFFVSLLFRIHAGVIHIYRRYDFYHRLGIRHYLNKSACTPCVRIIQMHFKLECMCLWFVGIGDMANFFFHHSLSLSLSSSTSPALFFFHRDFRLKFILFFIYVYRALCLNARLSLGLR